MIKTRTPKLRHNSDHVTGNNSDSRPNIQIVTQKTQETSTTCLFLYTYAPFTETHRFGLLSVACHIGSDHVVQHMTGYAAHIARQSKCKPIRLKVAHAVSRIDEQHLLTHVKRWKSCGIAGVHCPAEQVS